MFKAMSAMAAAGAASVAMGGTITTDFSGFSNGASVEGNTFNSGTAAEFVATSAGNNLGLRVFDTTPGGVNQNQGDNDLLVPGFGNALILQDKDRPGSQPNDANEGGTISFDFTAAVQLVSIDLIDIDRGARTTLTLTDSEGDTRVFNVPNNWTGEPGQPGAPGADTLDFATNNQVGFKNKVATFTDTGMFDLSGVISLDVFFRGSAALDNLVASGPNPGPLVPLPAPALLGLAGMGAIGGVRRRAC